MTDPTSPTTLEPAAPGLACDLEALDASERDQQAATFERLRQMVQAVEELPDGWAVRLPNGDDALRLIADLIRYERRCCPFFSFNLDVAADAGPIWLRLTGREGVKSFLSGAFAPGDPHD